MPFLFMDSRQIYKASERLGPLMTWGSDWIYFGTGNEINFDLLKSLIEDHLNTSDFLFIHGRTDSIQVKKEEIFKIIEPFIGIENFEIWSVKMDKAIRFNKIGVLLLGQKIEHQL